jgi:hypothetical protein
MESPIARTPDERTWHCRFLAPESAWQAEPEVRTSRPRSAGTAARELARDHIALGRLPPTGRGVVECQGASTVYLVQLRWDADEVQLEAVDPVG